MWKGIIKGSFHIQKGVSRFTLLDKQVVILINNKKYFCDNQDCSHKTFAERFDFIISKSRKSKRLIEKILKLSTMVSSVSASQILKEDMTIVSKSTICNLLKKMPSVMDKDSIFKICLDDFAFKKRYSYGTIMVDLDSYKIVDILNSRDKEPVVEWLRNYPNLEIVSRDGSQIYASAITEAHADAVQVSDRFHLPKNLSEEVERYMMRLFPARLEIPATAEARTPEIQALLDTRNREQRIRFARTKYEEGLTVSEIALLMHSSLSTVSKYLAMKEEDIPEDISRSIF